MIPIIKASEASLEHMKNLEIQAEADVEAVVDEIIAGVIARGDEALREYTAKFDQAKIDEIEVPREAIEAAYRSVDPALIEALTAAADNIEDFHKRQIRSGFAISEKPGVVLGQRVMPLDRVGLYIPGGTARYPSSVLMNAIPARLAGVSEIFMTTPPDPDGTVPAPILAAAKIAGVSRVFRAGGAQAVAALAYGTQSVPRVDKIVGPGNIYVATAKRRVYGRVDIDMIAGPSEILVIADSTADPRYLAADLLSQAEHDQLASAVLITDSAPLAEAVRDEIERQIPALSRAQIARASIDQRGRIMLVDSMAEAVALSNQIAPEHLELCVDDPFALLSQVKHAGSVFLGKYAPEALGDYWAGPNHTLPTSGTARFSSPLSVDDFIKKSSFIYYTREALYSAKDEIIRVAECEGLTAHARSVAVRFEEDGR